MYFEGALVSFLLSHIHRGDFLPWIFIIITVNVTCVICLNSVLQALGATELYKRILICRGIFDVGRIFVFCYDVSDYWESEFRVRQLTVNAPTLRHFVVLNLASMCFNDNCQYLPDAFFMPGLFQAHSMDWFSNPHTGFRRQLLFLSQCFVRGI